MLTWQRAKRFSKEAVLEFARDYLDGKLKLDELITRRISLSEINDGFAAMTRGEAVRTVIIF